MNGLVSGPALGSRLEVPDSDYRDFDRDRTQESLVEDRLNAFYAKIENDFDYLLNLPTANK